MRKKRKPPPGRTGRGQRIRCDRAKDHTPRNTPSTPGEQTKHVETPRLSFWPGREPFTVANLQKTLEDDGVLKDQIMPSRAGLSQLAASLNDIHGAFWFRKTTALESESKAARAERVGAAIQILMCFFDQRRQSWPRASSQVLVREQRLYDLFRDFVSGMAAHEFQLDMDIDAGAMMPRLESWRHVAGSVASAFTRAMLPQEFGRSNEGPVARFVAAVMPLMTNEKPTVAAVAQRLKRQARGKSSQQGQRKF
jgi:hypothetical protein